MTASLAIAYLILETVVRIFTKEKKIYTAKTALFAGLLGFTIGLPWLLPFLDVRFHHEAFNIAGRPFFWGVMSMITLAALLGYSWWKKTTLPFLTYFTLFVFVLSVLPFETVKYIELAVRGIHFYRFYPYALLLTPTALLGSKQLIKKVRWQPDTRILVSTVILGVAAICFHTITPFSNRFETYWDAIPSSFTGRVMDISNEKTLNFFCQKRRSFITRTLADGREHGFVF